MVGKNPANPNIRKGVDEQPLEPEILSPRTSTTSLMAVEETVGEINSCLINLQLTVERIARQMEAGMNAYLTTKKPPLEMNNGEIMQLTGHPKGPRFEGNNSETFNEAQEALKNY